MKSNLNRLLEQARSGDGETFECREEQVQKEAEMQHAAYSNIIIKVLSGLGGLLATLTLVAFLLLAGIYDSESAMLVMGIIFVVAAMLVSRVANHVFLDTITLTAYITGLLLTGAGASEGGYGVNSVLVMFLVIAITGILLSRGFMMVLVSVLLLNGVVFYYFPANHYYGYLQYFPIAYTGVVLYLVTAREPELIAGKSWINRLYRPVQAGFFLSFLLALLWPGALFFVGVEAATIRYHVPVWLLSALIDAGILLLLYRIVRTLGITNRVYITGITLAVLVLLAAVLPAPGIAGALFLLLLAVAYGYKAEVALSAAALAWFVTRFYYDMQYTLLVKSALLFFPGLLLLFVWFYFYKKRQKHEEI